MSAQFAQEATVKRRKFFKAAAVGAAGCMAAKEATSKGSTNAPADVADRPNSGPHVTWSRSVPLRYTADVAVIGGGIAGISAACAAARSGAKVVLVERFAVTGGDLTSGGVANFCGQITGQGEVFDEVLSELRAFNALDPDRPVFHYEILGLVLQEMLLKRGVKLLLHTRFVDAVVTDGRVTECILCGKSGPDALQA